MPLPAALLAKLKKRGLVGSELKVQEEEEVFAEDDADEDQCNPENFEYHSRKRNDNQWMQKVKSRFKETTKGVKGCPNKWNVHHICTVFCLERWGEGNEKPSKKYKERFQRLLDRYPLQKKSNWTYVWDSGCHSYYFWNKDDDTVSWLPPKHPKSSIGKSAASLRMPEMISTDPQEEAESFMPPSSHSPPPAREYHQKLTVTKKTKSRDLEKILRTKKGRRQFYENSQTIDPMDPASYSDIPKGRWSAGLENEGRGTDSAVSGTPGDNVRAQGKRREDSDGNEDDNIKKKSKLTHRASDPSE